VLQTASEGHADYRLLRLAKWLESRQVEPTKEVKKAMSAKAPGARKQAAAAGSVASDSSSKSNEALIQMIQSLQEEVAALREERPRKKAEKPDEQMTEGSFRVLSP
jgi:methylthioribose-1-phosphate isomerase